MNAWEKYEKMLEELGAERLGDAMMQAIDYDTLDWLMNEIARDYDVEFEEEE